MSVNGKMGLGSQNKGTASAKARRLRQEGLPAGMEAQGKEGREGGEGSAAGAGLGSSVFSVLGGWWTGTRQGLPSVL